MQDIRSRSVYWIAFPLLAASLVLLRYLQVRSVAATWQPALFNLGFVLLQLLLVTIYFSVKNKKWININEQMLGGGDILFILCICFYLSFLNFLFFYILSLLAILLSWFIWQLIRMNQQKNIPLAGLQAFLFALILSGDWWGKFYSVTNDGWLLNLISK